MVMARNIRIARTNSAELTAHAAAIRRLSQRCFEDLCEIGERLKACRHILKADGKWLEWLETEFGWSRRTAERFIALAEAQGRLGNLPTLLPISALYKLAKAPADVIEKVKQQLDGGVSSEARAACQHARAVATRSQPACRQRQSSLKVVRAADRCSGREPVCPSH
jgi:Protein of unknown function (DUF3102)